MAKKPTKRVVPAVEPARRVKVSVSLDAQVAQRLRAAAAYRGVDPCELVAQAVERDLARFVVYERPITGELPSQAPETAQERPTPPQVYRAG